MTHPAAPLTRRHLLTTLASAAGLLALSACAGPAQAHRSLAALEVFDRDSGRVVPSHFHEGRHYVAGRPGARYALRLRNLSGQRVLVVLSVDGVNVVTGDTAEWSQTGYVLDPGRSYDINGWRKSDTEVAAFEFAPIERSYAARTGRPDHVGVIGMAVFRERPLPPPPPPAPPVAAAPIVGGRLGESSATAAAPAAPAAPVAPQARAEALRRDKSAENSADSSAGARLGTGHGQREWSVSRRTAFERATRTPEQVTQIEYDSAERLIAAGIIAAPQWHARPRPFPGNPVGYVPDPPRW